MACSNTGFTAARTRHRNVNHLYSPDVTPARVLLCGAGVPARDASLVLSLAPSQVSLASLPRLEVRESPGRGYGLFTAEKISAYSRILEDHALLSLSKGEDLPQLWPKYLALPSEDRQVFDELNAPDYQLAKEAKLSASLRKRGYSKDDSEAMARVSSRFIGNSFKSTSESDKKWHHCLFANVARINHSCTPNAHGHYRSNATTEYIYALRDIEAGEEIEITYFDMTLPLADRQARTRAWSFTCRCPACSGKLDADYERRLAIVHKWNEGDSQMQYRHPPRSPNLTQPIYRAINIALSDDLPWLRASLPGLYVNYFGALMNNRRPKREVFDAYDSYLLWQGRLQGEDDPQFARAKAAHAELRRTTQESRAEQAARKLVSSFGEGARIASIDEVGELLAKFSPPGR